MNVPLPRRGARLAVATLLALTLGLPLALPAAAAQATSIDACAAPRATFLADRTLANAMALADCMAGARQTFLSTATARVQGSKALTSKDRSALLSILSTDASGVSGLKAEADVATTVADAIADARAMVLDYRVFVLGGRQVALLTGADGVVAVAARFDSVHQKLETLIDAAAAQGRDVTAARASLAAMDASVAGARTDVDGLQARILALTPAEWNVGTAKPVLDAARSSISAARDALVAARKDAAAVPEDLGR